MTVLSRTLHDRGTDKEDVACIQWTIRHKKEWNWIICRDVHGLLDTVIQSESQISYMNAYMENVGKWYRGTYLQSRNRDTDVENKCMDTKRGEAGWDELGDWD